METVLEVRELETVIETRSGLAKPVDGVTFSVKRGETVCLVGESGCGKSMTALSILRLLRHPAKIVGGHIQFRDTNVLELNQGQMRDILGSQIGIVFQDPMSALNPLLKIGEQITEPLVRHRGLSARQAWAKAAVLLEQLKLSEPERIMKLHPHQLSGGMKQRVLLAIALSCEPQLLIADEPTTALDVTLQAEFLELLQHFKEKAGLSVLLITHDLGVAAEAADTVVVMYGGKVVETASVFELFADPKHPYTRGLLRSRPTFLRKERLESINGEVQAWTGTATNCRFHERCDQRMEVCSKQVPHTVSIQTTHKVACWLYEDLAPRSGE